MQLSLSHLGYLPSSPRTLTLLPGDRTGLPERVPFFLRQNCLRLPRDTPPTPGFSARFPAPYDLLQGKLKLEDAARILHQGELHRIDSRWGTLWQADFSEFSTPGSYQIEIEEQISPPFAIREHVYDLRTGPASGQRRARLAARRVALGKPVLPSHRIIPGYLTFLKSPRRKQGVDVRQGKGEPLAEVSGFVPTSACGAGRAINVEDAIIEVAGIVDAVGYSFRIPQLPEAVIVGFIGPPDDSPYLEESTATEWNTLEYWSIPYQNAAQAAAWLRA